jgi:hypothetical protein
VLRIILAGQPELSDKLDSAQLAQLVQRVRLRFHLTPLSQSDTNGYIEHRLAVAGSGGRKLFAPETFDLIFRYSGGVPRLINTLCDTALLAAFAQDRPTVGLEDVQGAIDELRWVEYARRPHVHAAESLANENEADDEEEPEEEPPPRSVDQPALGRIVVRFDGEDQAELELRTGRLVIGRTPDNDLQIDSKWVSRHHAQIITTRHTSVLEDLNSTNGVFIAGKRVRRRLLNDRDVIQIGRHDIIYVDERDARAPSASAAIAVQAPERASESVSARPLAADVAFQKT